LTDDDTSDAAMIGDFVVNSGGKIRTVIADGAYDGAPSCQAIRAARPDRSPPRIVIPPGRSAMDMAAAHWSRSSFPGSRGSMADGAPPELWVPSKSMSPFTSNSQSATGPSHDQG
jgi:hypothetical protein